MKHKQTIATNIPKAVKDRVFERDEERCVWCGRSGAYVLPEAHYIPRSKGGLGIEENVLTLCRACHDRFDNGGRLERDGMREFLRDYLQSKYPDWNEDNLKYRKENI